MVKYFIRAGKPVKKHRYKFVRNKRTGEIHRMGSRADIAYNKEGKVVYYGQGRTGRRVYS